MVLKLMYHGISMELQEYHDTCPKNMVVSYRGTFLQVNEYGKSSASCYYPDFFFFKHGTTVKL